MDLISFWLRNIYSISIQLCCKVKEKTEEEHEFLLDESLIVVEDYDFERLKTQ